MPDLVVLRKELCPDSIKFVTEDHFTKDMNIKTTYNKYY